MQSGKMDQRITIQSNTWTVDSYGSPIFTWSDRASVAAQVIQRSTSEFMANYGIADKAIIIFRIRWLDGVNNADRVLFGGRQLQIKEIVALGRREALEIRCEDTAAAA
jgi:SPP1 family predicted phage head-tail adaptor